MQREGALKVARPKGSQPLPPFHKWSFREERYIQWLADMHTVHYALEAAVADATTVAATEQYGEPVVACSFLPRLQPSHWRMFLLAVQALCCMDRTRKQHTCSLDALP